MLEALAGFLFRITSKCSLSKLLSLRDRESSLI